MSAAGKVSVVVLTFNEAPNIERCLRSVTGWADEVHVVDSLSTDATVALAQRFTSNIHSHAFENHTAQWRWVLDTVPLRNEWVLALDADLSVSSELRRSIDGALAADTDTAGYYMRRVQVFRGRTLKHGTMSSRYYLGLFKRDRVFTDPDALVDMIFYVDGSSATLEGDLIEDNAKDADIGYWINKQIAYAERQAREEWAQRKARPDAPERPTFFGTPNQRRLWLKRILLRFPLFTRPFIYFIYRYFLRLGFLDGKEGLVFHFTQALLYRLLVDVNLSELRKR